MAKQWVSDASCVAAWLFTEGENTTVADSSANSNTGTFKGSGEPAWSTDVPSFGTSGTAAGSVLYDATDDVISCGTSNAILPQSTACTVTAWVKVGDASANQRIIDRWDVHWTITNGILQFHSLGATNTFRNSANSVVTSNTWIHFAVTWDGTTTATGIKYYKNGAETSYGTAYDGATPTSNSGDTTYLGNRYDGTRCLTGRLSETAVFNKVLSQSEIAEIYNYGLNPEGASESPSASPSVSPSASPSSTPSVSPSASPTQSESPSASPSGDVFSGQVIISYD